jgi:hypothetical protein
MTMSTQQHDSTAPPRERPRKRHELAEIGMRLLDEAHTTWQWAELECEAALHAWYERSPRTNIGGYLAYRAALDREEAAAHDLQRLWELARSGHDALKAASLATTEVSS